MLTALRLISALEAEIYEHEGNDQQTYLLLFRHAQLVLGNLLEHPDARFAESRSALSQAGKEVDKNLQRLEVLKPRINKRYERFEQLMQDRRARQTTEDVRVPALKSINGGRHDEENHQRLPSDPAMAGNTETLAAGENKELAVKLAHQEIRRRATARKATRLAGISDEVEQQRRSAGHWGNWEEALADDEKGLDGDTLSHRMQNIRLQVDGGSFGTKKGISEPTSGDKHSVYNYPNIPEKSTQRIVRPDASSSLRTLSTASENFPHPSNPPKRPPKKNGFPSHHNPPPRPEKSFLLDEGYSSRSETSSPPPPPTPNELKPATFTFTPSAHLENGSPLRTVFLPPDLRHRFLSIAQPNTRANLETCGILCGTLISNALFISKLVIPEQESTSDTCETVNENEVFDYVDGEDLMVLGWIHTHPTQTCFMSSRDLHTHSGYQVMMPESIAIVCAPSKEE